MPRLASFDLVRHPPSVLRTVTTLARVPIDRRSLIRVDGLVLGRLLGTAAGDSTAGGADLSRWALLAVWEDREALDRFRAAHPLAGRWRHEATERWSATLTPRRSRGRWAGVDPFRPSDLVPETTGPVAVLTRATVRARRLRPFHAARGPVDAALHRAAGLVDAVGMGEWPVGQQATFSLWRDEAAVRQFSGRDPAHAEVVRRTRAERWYREELFAAFTVEDHDGTWAGRDPLAGLSGRGTEVRLARPDDLAGLGALELAAGRRFDGHGLANLDDTVPADLLVDGQRKARLWVADDAGTVVGFALATTVDGEAHLREIAVAVDHGGQGLGTRLVEAALDWARIQELPAVTLTTFVDIAWNGPWYERLGFRTVAAEDRGPGLRAVVAEEAAAGLDMERRTVMRRALRGPTAPR